MLKDFYNKNSSRIIKTVVFLILIIILWLLVLKPFIKFKTNEKTMLEAAKRYYEINTSALPIGSRISSVTLQKLYDKDLIEKDLTSSYLSKLCDTNKSWVKVRKEKTEYKYYVNLKCGVLSSSGADNKGPVITLKGPDTITHDRTEKFKDPGIASVIDNNDGNIKISKVKIDDKKLNTKKNGTYEIKYSVKDSFGNETVKIRKVIVNQTLENTVVKDTKKNNNGNYYTADNQNNYIMIDGIVFRIIGKNNDGIKVVSDNPLATVDKKSVDNWLNNFFYNKLSDNIKQYIVSSKYCSEEVSEPDGTTECNKTTSKKKVGLLSTMDLIKTKGQDMNDSNYIYGNFDSYRLLTSNNYYLNSDNEFKKAKEKGLYGIRPTLVLKNDTVISSGDGTTTGMYKVKGQKSKKTGTKISEVVLGNYINYSGYTWIVSDINENKEVQITMTSTLNKQEDSIMTSFDQEKKYYNTNNLSNIGYKISNEYSSYVNTSLFANHNYKVYKYKGNPSFNGNDKYKKTKAKIILVSMFDIFGSGDNNNYMCRESNDKNVYSNTGLMGIVKSTYTEEQAIKLSGYLKSKVTIKSGDGSINRPYRLSK